jgi:hypothetical protein
MVAYGRYEQYRRKNVKEQTCINQYRVQAGPHDRNMTVAAGVYRQGHRHRRAGVSQSRSITMISVPLR